jgi:hypothetical protein
METLGLANRNFLVCYICSHKVHFDVWVSKLQMCTWRSSHICEPRLIDSDIAFSQSVQDLDNNTIHCRLLARICFKGGVFNPLHLNAKKYFKRFKSLQKLHFFMKHVLFGLNKMCKAHFHPFAVIISPFHAMGMQKANGESNLHRRFSEVLAPHKMPWREHCIAIRHFEYTYSLGSLLNELLFCGIALFHPTSEEYH